MSVSPAGASINYNDHNTFASGSPHSYRVYLSPGHTSSAQNQFPCYDTSKSEWNQAWQIARAARDELVDRGYRVMMPKQSEDVSYPDRIDTADDWKTPSPKFAYVTFHSNAHGSINCGHSGGAHGGTQLLYENNGDDNLGDFIYDYIKTLSPGSAHESKQGPSYCNSSAIYELCTGKALSMPTAYMEFEFHDTNQGAQWLIQNSGQAGYYTAHGIDCFLAEIIC